MHNQAIHLSTARVVIGGAAMVFGLVFSLGFISVFWTRSAQAGTPDVAAASAGAAPAAPAPARTVAEPARKADKVGTTPAAARPGAEGVRRDARRAGSGDGDAYRCHPNEDIACTVVRETAQGMSIVTLRPGGPVSPGASWSVVSGSPPGAAAYPGGIIYVVPTAPTRPPQFEAMAQAQDPTLITANNAPILE